MGRCESKFSKWRACWFNSFAGTVQLTATSRTSISSGENAHKIVHGPCDQRACSVSPSPDFFAATGKKSCSEWPLLNRHLGQLAALKSRDVDAALTSPEVIPGKEVASVFNSRILKKRRML